MGIALGDLIQVVAAQVYLGIEALNVYYYRYVVIAPADNSVYPVLLTQFETKVLDVVRTCQSGNVSYTSITMKNLTNEIDEYSETYTPGTDKPGTVAGESLPSFNAYSFRLLRDSGVTRHGYKRFVGVAEPSGQGNGYSPGSTIITNVTNALTASLDVGLVPTLMPIIVKRPIPQPATGYLYSGVSAAEFRGVGSQNTRKS